MEQAENGGFLQWKAATSISLKACMTLCSYAHALDEAPSTPSANPDPAETGHYPTRHARPNHERRGRTANAVDARGGA